ncbi:hypothetical protein M406DRAFT_327229 [Cryphonectria parasitica EP155]|uniref:Uncharacterized protein n=1 Tax=Cryphonectria parasitica (strain ATCC 38755 / EP155) TaxID=660469 RepID=A0A9P4Y8Q4_CRYP1|nr:uncharacterized protein M406DRAFT_327229 [Cryphonectria parasitica EP155]KAF3768811.1 hypothetical protein M406DRAFT_327229 [Cryphonectria parasitica EP155]
MACSTYRYQSKTLEVMMDEAKADIIVGPRLRTVNWEKPTMTIPRTPLRRRTDGAYVEATREMVLDAITRGLSTTSKIQGLVEGKSREYGQGRSAPCQYGEKARVESQELLDTCSIYCCGS